MSEGRDEVDDVDADEVPHRNKAGQQDGGDEDDHGRIDEFLVFLETLDLRVGLPGPVGLAEFAFHLADKAGNKGGVPERDNRRYRKHPVDHARDDPVVADLEKLEETHATNGTG